MPAIPTFISFDAEHDEDLKNLLNGQAKNPDSPFSIINWSVNEPFQGNWQQKVRARMKHARVIAVICGQHTQTARGVSVEIEIAREEKIPYFLLQGRPNRKCTKPKAAMPYDIIYPWTWDNLKQLINGQR